MAKVRLPFGLRGDRLLSISEVARGLACNCVCPACGQPLVARKGAGRMHHFAHYQEEGCGYGLETALHYAAKQVLAEAGRIKLPAVFLDNRKLPVFPARMMYIDALRMEQRTGQLVPDLLLRSGRRWLLVEIAVTHPSGREKIQRIRRMGYAALEVNLRDLREKIQKPDIGWETAILKRRLIWEQSGKHWLFNPRRNALEAELHRQAVSRKVHYRRYHHRHYYTVRPCPVSRRVWHINAIQRFSYARVFQDCLHCEHCSEIRYRKTYRGYRELPTLPEEVWCWGDQPNLIDLLR